MTKQLTFNAIDQAITREEAKIAIINYIETWYNSRRSRSSLDYMSPTEYELHHSQYEAIAA